MKPAWYEPNLCMCTPENPNTMGVCATLTEPLYGEALWAAVERLRKRFPYFYVRAKVEDNNTIKAFPPKKERFLNANRNQRASMSWAPFSSDR